MNSDTPNRSDRSHDTHITFRVVASEQDATLAYQFFSKMLAEQFSLTFSASALDAYRNKYSLEVFERRTADKKAVLAAAFDGNAMIALVIGGVPNGGVASLDWVVVSPGYQGRGVGHRLVHACLSEYRNTGAHKVVLYSETEQGKRFYEKCGFSCEGVHPQHWWGLTHYCMGYILEEANRADSGRGPV